jgi:hypothetical protein
MERINIRAIYGGNLMSEQQAEEIIEALEVEETPKPKKRVAKKVAAPAGLSDQTIRARAVVLGRLKG